MPKPSIFDGGGPASRRGRSWAGRWAGLARAVVVAGVLWAPVCASAAEEEPALPPGLAPAEEAEPPLPSGLDAPAEGDEPALPEGLGGEAEPSLPPGLSGGEAEGPPPSLRERLPFEISGFWETRLGVRVREDRYERDASIAEQRLQFDLEEYWNDVRFKLTTDFLADAVNDNREVRLERGASWVDLREANVTFTPARFMDVRAGRQILTWGTGDLLFLNDLFPKDWNSFLIGRDTEYLKAPSDAIKVSLFSDAVNLDLVFTPRFDPDRYVDGSRLSYWNQALGRRAGRDAVVDPITPDSWFKDEEWAVRLHRNVGAYELAAYGYRGFWKSPAGMDGATGRPTFPDLAVYGASGRGPVLRGIGNVEVAYYDSEDDRGGDDPFVRNSEARALVGYEQEVARDFTVGVQYYVEYMMSYNDYRRGLPAGAPAADEDRHVVTLRLTKLLMDQNLRLSLFTFYSPSDHDAYLRPSVNYKVDDHWSLEAGANLFPGAQPHTFFHQFDRDSNVYAGVRYGF